MGDALNAMSKRKAMSVMDDNIMNKVGRRNDKEKETYGRERYYQRLY